MALPESSRRPYRDLVSLAGGSSLAALLAYAAQPILSRLYAPETFGIADLFAAVVAVVVPVGSLRYEDALILPESDEDAAHLFWLSVFITLVLTGVVFALSLAVPTFKETTLGPFLWLLAPTLLLLRLGRLTELWLTRQRQFSPLAISPVARSTVATGWRLVGGLPPFGATAGGLIYGFLTGQGAGVLIQLAGMRRSVAVWHSPQWAGMRRVATRYRRFALYTTPAVLLNNLTSRLPIFVLAYAFSEGVVGWFGRVVLTLAVPLSLVGGALGRVFLPDAAQARHSGTLALVSATFHSRLVWLGLYPALALMVAGPDLFAFVFGDLWREAGTYARWLSPWLLLSAICAPLTALFDVTERHRLDVATGVFQLVVLGGALYLGVRTGSALYTIACVGIGGVLGRGVQLGVLWRISGASMASLPAQYIRPLGAAGAGLFFVVPALAMGTGLTVFLAVVAGGGVYYFFAYRAEKAYNSGRPPSEKGGRPA